MPLLRAVTDTEGNVWEEGDSAKVVQGRKAEVRHCTTAISI